jgi:3-oxoacyl-[acyl-carrier-protein] synthase II
MTMDRRVVITGMGAVTPLGLELKTTWENLVRARSAIGYISLFDASSFPVKIAAEVKEFDESSIELPEYMEPFASRATKFCLAATHEAIQHASLDLATIDPTMFGISLGGNEEASRISGLSTAFNESDIYTSLKDRKSVV